MKLLIIQLSDMHFENEDQVHSVKTDKMIATINAVVHADECIIIISGDMETAQAAMEFRLEPVLRAARAGRMVTASTSSAPVRQIDEAMATAMAT